MADLLACAPGALGAGWVSAHLLLLSRRLLQGVLGRSARLHGRRTAQDLSRRALVPAHHAECASLFSLPRADYHPRSSRTMSGKRCGSRIRRRARRPSGWVSARSCSAVNVVLLGGYTFGCHSLRHLVGGFLDQFSKSPTCYRAYSCVGCLNRRHMLWAWMSLFWVGFSDVYVRLVRDGRLARSAIFLGPAPHARLRNFHARRSGHRQRAAPVCARRSKRPRPAFRSAWFRNVCSAKPTP